MPASYAALVSYSYHFSIFLVAYSVGYTGLTVTVVVVIVIEQHCHTMNTYTMNTIEQQRTGTVVMAIFFLDFSLGTDVGE